MFHSSSGQECRESVLIIEECLGVAFFEHEVWQLLWCGDTINSGVSMPGGNTKGELYSWVWEEKCNNFQLNAPTLANTMGLSLTCVRPPHTPLPAFRERGLQGSSTNEAAGISLVGYKPLFGAFLLTQSCSQYQRAHHFFQWKGFTINDAIMLMVGASCSFASPPQHQSPLKKENVKVSVYSFGTVRKEGAGQSWRQQLALKKHFIVMLFTLMWR